MKSKKIEVWVGLFVVIALIAVVFLSLKVADIKEVGNQPTYRVYASFGNIGGLKERSPVKIGGVVIGRVASITLKEEMEGNYRPEVALDILNIYDHIPDSSSLSIRTSGLLGEQFLALNLGFYDEDLGSDFLKDGGRITNTHSAMVLEDLIGQFLYKTGDGDGKTTSDSKTQTEQPALP
ncbi:outer membrane lipid asymmetry maintenance protein MlaD [Proteus mirabilis]|nr:outer membrane lipid asymmetry maintenance protein MlaD [Proteus mirabilis]